jgi:hypothetical protein
VVLLSSPCRTLDLIRYAMTSPSHMGLNAYKPLTIRRRLTVTAQMLGISLTIKRSGEDIYFWSESEPAVQPRPRRRSSRRARQDDTTVPETSEVDAGHSSDMVSRIEPER